MQKNINFKSKSKKEGILLWFEWTDKENEILRMIESLECLNRYILNIYSGGKI